MLLFDLFQAEYDRECLECEAIISKPRRFHPDEAKFRSHIKHMQDCQNSMYDLLGHVVPPDQGVEYYKQVSDLCRRTEMLERSFASASTDMSKLEAISSKPIGTGGFTQSVNKSLSATRDLESDVNQLEQILKSGQNAEMFGAETLIGLNSQREQMARTRQNVGRTDLSLKDSNAVLNRVSNWFNQFR